MTKLTELYIGKFAIQLSGSDIANNHKGFVLESERRITPAALFHRIAKFFQPCVNGADGKNFAKATLENGGKVRTVWQRVAFHFCPSVRWTGFLNSPTPANPCENE